MLLRIRDDAEECQALVDAWNPSEVPLACAVVAVSPVEDTGAEESEVRFVDLELLAGLSSVEAVPLKPATLLGGDV